MTVLNRKVSTGFVVLVALGAAGTLAGCQAPAQNDYKLTKTETVTDQSSGVRKQVSYWEHANGATTKSVETVFRTDAGRSPRGSKGQRP